MSKPVKSGKGFKRNVPAIYPTLVARIAYSRGESAGSNYK